MSAQPEKPPKECLRLNQRLQMTLPANLCCGGAAAIDHAHSLDKLLAGEHGRHERDYTHILDTSLGASGGVARELHRNRGRMEALGKAHRRMVDAIPDRNERRSPESTPAVSHPHTLGAKS